jgi:hypothetical protein
MTLFHFVTPLVLTNKIHYVCTHAGIRGTHYGIVPFHKMPTATLFWHFCPTNLLFAFPAPFAVDKRSPHETSKILDFYYISTDSEETQATPHVTAANYRYHDERGDYIVTAAILLADMRLSTYSGNVGSDR